MVQIEIEVRIKRHYRWLLVLWMRLHFLLARCHVISADTVISRIYWLYEKIKRRMVTINGR